MPRPRHVAVAITALTCAVLLGAGLLAAAEPTAAGLLTVGIAVLVSVTAGSIGVTVARQADNAAGAYLALLAVTAALTATTDLGVRFIAARPDVADRWIGVIAVMSEVGWWVLVAVGLLLLHFPDGRLPTARWRWAVAGLLIGGIVIQTHGAVQSIPFPPPLHSVPRPFGPPPAWLETLSIFATVAVLALLMVAVWSLVRRHRDGSPAERRRLRWLGVAGVLVAGFPLVCLVEIALWGRPLWLSAVVGLTGLVAVPATVGVGILRPDVYDVDRALAETVTWFGVSGLLLTGYAAVTTAVGVALGRDSPAVAAVAAALAALALAPLRRRVQRIVDRRLNPARRSVEAAVQALQRDVAAGTSDPERLEAVLRESLRDPGLRLGYRPPAGGHHVDAQGRELPTAGGVPVVLGGQHIGTLVAGSELVTSDLLRHVAERVTTLVETVRLRLGLAEALREVEQSRSRLVLLGFEERRRLERDLHDGAQQRLVSLGMGIRLAQRHLEDGTVDVDDLLETCMTELATAVAELRQIAHGIRPSSLDDGLPVAIGRLVRTLPVEVEVRVDASELPDDVATTVYYVVSEALTNAVKHAQATRIELDVRYRSGRVHVRIRDDGRGGAQLPPESALVDRVAALGGRLRVLSPPGHGTAVEAELPCAS